MLPFFEQAVEPELEVFPSGLVLAAEPFQRHPYGPIWNLHDVIFPHPDFFLLLQFPSLRQSLSLFEPRLFS